MPSSPLPVVRRFVRLSLAASMVLVAGCYNYAPLSVVPVAEGRKQVVELLLNDRGRAEFVDKIGPDALAVEGTLVQRQDSSYVVEVQSVSYFNRSASKWTGERLSVNANQVRDVRAKRLARGRTFAAIGGSLGLFAAFVLTRSIILGGESRTPGGGGTPIDQ